MNSVPPEEDFVPTTDDFIRSRLIHVLTIYPGISPSMLQVGIGTALSPKMWHPIMDKLKADGIVKEDEFMAQAPNGRDLTYKKLVLVSQEPAVTAMILIPRSKCPECGSEVFNSPGGIVCAQGHGGIILVQEDSNS